MLDQSLLCDGLVHIVNMVGAFLRLYEFNDMRNVSIGQPREVIFSGSI